ncbi:pilin [Candidatus Saccharibacteria bacterium]|nr:pilin [Candidatus Saccharibacteria bacterium]
MKILYSVLLSGDPLPHTKASSLTDIINIVLAIMGALAFLMIVIAGLRYAANGGNADTVASARRQILYSLVGLIVIALAAAIVNFVLGQA